MNAKFFRIAGLVALLLAITGSALAQQTSTTTTQTTAVQNPDGYCADDCNFRHAH